MHKIFLYRPIATTRASTVLTRWAGRLAGQIVLTAVLWATLAVGVFAPALAQPTDPAATPATNGPKIASFEAVALHPTREVSAVVVARNESRLSAEVAGAVLRWGPDTGATIKRGALLVEIDDVDYRLARDRALAALAASTSRGTLAEQRLKRAKELVAQEFISREALNAVETESQLASADLASNRLALTAAERNLARTRITAPFDASVRQRLAQAGESVAPGTPLYVLAETSGAELSAQLSPEDVASLRLSPAPSFVRTDGSAVAVKLLRISGVLNAPARTVEVRLGAPGLVPGRDGRLRWRDPRPHVPAALLVRREGTLGVFVARDGKAHFLPLPGAQEGRATAADLASGTMLVTQGHQALRDGDALAP